MDLKRIIRTGETELQLTMKVADFLQISPLRRKTGVHIHILKKRGPLFFLLFCKRRKMIPAGFLAVFCLIFFLYGNRLPGSGRDVQILIVRIFILSAP